MKGKVKLAAWLFCCAGMITFCKRERSCEDCGANNTPPIARAGADQVIGLPVDSSMLDGRSSTDADGKITGWRWTKIAGPGAGSLVNPDSAATPVKLLVAGVYQFELQVSDDKGASTSDTVQLTVATVLTGNRPPVANAGPDQTLFLTAGTFAYCRLNGSASTDPDNNMADYLWVKISGPSGGIISTANTVQTDVNNLLQGVYQFELKVTDAGGLFSKDTVRITVNEAAAIALCDSNRPQVNAQLVPVGTLSVARMWLSVASAGNKILFAGGFTDRPSSRVDMYDLTAQTWTTAELSVARYGISAVANSNKIVFGGGEISDGTFPVNTVDIYDVSTDGWSTASLGAPGTGMATAAVDNKVMFAGGEDGFARIPGTPRNTMVDICDLSTGSWSTASLSEARNGGHVAVTSNNKVHIAGGADWSSGWIPLAKIDIYDHAATSWSTSFMLQGKTRHAGIALNNKIYWAGGQTGSTTPTCTVEIKDANSGSSTVQYLFRPTHWSHAVVKDNKIVFFGGNNAGSNANKFDIYDAATNTWSVGVLPLNIRPDAIISVNNIIYLAGGTINGALSNQVWKLNF